MSTSFISKHQQDAVLTLTLNRPDKLNSFTVAMAKQLQEALTGAGANKEVRCVLLTGNGKAFCVGQDLPEVVNRARNEQEYSLGDTVRESYNPLIRGIRQLEKPVVCAVNGTAAGAGANLAFACDLVLASRKAIFLQSFSKIGLIPDSGGTYMLPRLVGLQQANAMYLLDEKISADRAVEMGLIYKAVDEEKLRKESATISRKLASLPTKGFGLYKKAVNQTFNHSLNEQLELEAQLQGKAGTTNDYKEGVEAFMEKRRPEFKGR